ncbi:MAG: hypothetical protein AAGA85_24500, partial [Bacteroidota bacterium]
MKIRKIGFLLWLVTVNSALAQVDTVRFANGNEIYGEIKSMDQGVLEMEADYSDSDFKIEWGHIKNIHTANAFLISLSNGRRINGTFRSLPGDSLEIDAIGGIIEVDAAEVVFLSKVEEGFNNRFNANIDLSSSFTKANSLRQLAVRSGLGYQ